MNTIKNKVLIRAFKDEKAFHEVKGTDIKLQILTHFREHDEDICTHSGIVVAAPMKYAIKDAYGEQVGVCTDIEIKEGDKIYTHHFLTHEENDASILAPNTFAMEYDEIYCKVVDGEIEMLKGWNFLEPIEEENESKSGLIITANPKKIPGRAIMRHPSKDMRESGVVEGTEVLFKKNAGYVILVEGKKYYRVKDELIFGIYG